MVDKLNESQNVSTQNKGVNITSDEFVIPEGNPSEGTNTEFPSLYDVRNQLQNVIDVMGTTTPHLVYSSVSGDADNEESVISSTSIISSVLQVKHLNRNRDQCQSISTFNSPRDVSEISTVHESETYAMVNELPHEKPPQALCVPAVFPPAVLCMNPSCICTHGVGYMQQIPMAPNGEETTQNRKINKDKPEKKHKLNILIEKLSKHNKESEPSPMELYKMNIMQPKDNASPPKRFVFDLVEGVPKPEVNTVGTNTKSCNHVTCSDRSICINEQTKKISSKQFYCTTHKGISTHNSHYSGMVFTQNPLDEKCKLQHATYYKNLEEKSKLYYRNQKDTARVDVYYFDHGNAAYYRTTDSPPLILTEILAEKAERYATKFWAELFGTIYIGFAFFTSFILQFFRFLLHSVVRPLTIGLLQLVSDYFFKPFLATLFNAVIQPPLIFLYNIATSLRDFCDPVAEGLGYFLREIAVLCKSIRLFEVKQDKHNNAEKSCKNQAV